MVHVIKLGNKWEDTFDKSLLADKNITLFENLISHLSNGRLILDYTINCYFL